MKRLLLVLLLLTFGCKSTKNIQTKAKKPSKTHSERIVSPTKNTLDSNESLADNLIETAKTYEGTRYKYGGTTKRGMDCSGLVSTVYNSENIQLPRTTSELAKTGDWIDLKEVKKGDLLFFATSKNSRSVNHVGIVTDARVGYVEFIHASTSAGVIISSLSEKYWYFAFVQARRVL